MLSPAAHLICTVSVGVAIGLCSLRLLKSQLGESGAVLVLEVECNIFLFFSFSPPSASNFSPLLERGGLEGLESQKILRIALN